MSIYAAFNDDGIIGVGSSAKKVVALALASVGKRRDLTSEKFQENFPAMKKALTNKGSVEISGTGGKKAIVDFFPSGTHNADEMLEKRFKIRAGRSGKSFVAINKRIPRKAAASS